MSSHYIFHYFSNSEAERDIEYIVEIQETAYKKIIVFLEIDAPNQPIEYFFYPDGQTKKELMGDDWYARSIYNEFRIHILYTKKDKPIGEHEDTHLLSLSWGLAIGFLQEGLAEYMAGRAWDGTAHAKYCKEGYEQQYFPSIRILFDHKEWMERSEINMIYFYSLAGAFAAYLIRTYGKERFKSLYHKISRKHSRNQNSIVFREIYGKTIDEMETEFKQKALF